MEFNVANFYVHVELNASLKNKHNVKAIWIFLIAQANGKLWNDV